MDDYVIFVVNCLFPRLELSAFWALQRKERSMFVVEDCVQFFGISEVGTSEVGTYEVDTSEVGISEVGTSEVGISEVGISEVGISEVGIAEVGTSEVGISEVGISEVGIAEVGIAEVGTSEVGTSEVGISEVGISEVGTSEVGISEVGIAEVGTSEVGISEVGISEVGIAEVGIAEVGTSEVGIAEVGFHFLPALAILIQPMLVILDNLIEFIIRVSFHTFLVNLLVTAGLEPATRCTLCRALSYQLDEVTFRGTCGIEPHTQGIQFHLVSMNLVRAERAVVHNGRQITGY